MGRWVSLSETHNAQTKDKRQKRGIHRPNLTTLQDGYCVHLQACAHLQAWYQQGLMERTSLSTTWHVEQG